MVNRRHFVSHFVPLVPALWGARVVAQEARFSARANVVELQVTVRTQAGRIATDLVAADFSIEDNGRQVPIRYFSRLSDPPLIIGLLLDSSGSARDLVQDEAKAARKLLRQLVRPQRDRAFVARFSDQVELMQDLTSSLDDLETALERVAANRRGVRLSRGGAFPFQSPGQLPERQGLPLPNPSRGITFPLPASSRPKATPQPSTCLFDAVYLSSVEILGDQTGRKAIVLASDGRESGSKMSLEDAIAEAQRAEVQIYAVRFEKNNRAREMPSRELERLAAETGGAFFENGGRQSLDEISKRIDEELRHHYSLGFTPAAEGIGQRQVRVTVNRPGYIVHTRAGYYAEQ